MNVGCRNQVIVVGELDEPIFRRLLLIPQVFQFRTEITSQEICEAFRYAKALVLYEKPGRVGRIQRPFTCLIRHAELHGLHISLLAETEECLGICEGILRQARIDFPWGHALTAKAKRRSEVELLAEEIWLHDVSPAQKSFPRLHQVGRDLSDDEAVLLRRAFYDCDEIRVEEMFGGKVAKGVFKVYATTDEHPGRCPLPFFVKVVAEKSFCEELNYYRLHIAPFVPFNLRPNLIEARCAKGIPIGILVGNMVEGAIPIRDAYRTGSADGAIFSLFEITLRGLRAQVHRCLAPNNLSSFLLARIKPEKLRAIGPFRKVVERAKAFGLKRSPLQIARSLARIAERVEVNVSATHNDLHCGNVLVKRGEAVIIDFGSVNQGPLSSDPLTLEVSFVFGVDKPGESFEDWRAFVDETYGTRFNFDAPIPESIPSALWWLNRAIREVRHVLLGSYCANGEPSLVLAAMLLRIARLQTGSDEPPEISERMIQQSAYALVVAERILLNLKKHRFSAKTRAKKL